MAVALEHRVPEPWGIGLKHSICREETIETQLYPAGYSCQNNQHTKLLPPKVSPAAVPPEG